MCSGVMYNVLVVGLRGPVHELEALPAAYNLADLCDDLSFHPRDPAYICELAEFDSRSNEFFNCCFFDSKAHDAKPLCRDLESSNRDHTVN